MRKIFVAINDVLRFNGKEGDAGVDDQMPILNYSFIKASDADAFILFSPTVTFYFAAIGAPVIHNDDFKVAVGLPHDALEAVVQKCHGVIDRDDDRYQRLLVHGFISLSTQSHP